MKSTTTAALLLAAASTALATPSGLKREIKRDAQPLRITDIDAFIYEQSDTATHFVRLSFTDPIGAVSSNCQGSWADAQGQHPDHCTDTSYLVDFPNGLSNIDDFVLRVYSENGSADSKGHIGGSNWQCEAHNDHTPIKRTCKWVGRAFNLE